MHSRRSFLKLSAAGAAALWGLGSGGCHKGGGGSVTIGSKSFQEQWILSALIAQLIERTTKISATTKDLGGTMLCHKAILHGDIDCYVEYTGTAFTAVLKHYPISNVQEVYQRVKKDYAEKFHLLWLPPLGFQNTFAILVRKQDAEKYGLAKISDLTKVASQFRPGFGFEFYGRADGYRGLIETYGLHFGKAPKQMKLGLTYRALSAGDVDVIAGNSTDGQIAQLGLVMLEDDKSYFPPYQAAPVLRLDTATKYPAVKAAIEKLAGAVSPEQMRRANYAVSAKHEAPPKVAKRLLDSLKLA